MPVAPSASPNQFIQGAPVLHVPDVMATARYYRDVLGFTWDYGDKDYCVVWRDNSAVHFTLGEQAPAGVHLFQWVKDVDGLHAEIIGNGAVVSVELMDRPYGIRDFSVTDPNGVAIVFGQDID
ncbi:MAG: hypothetical protein HOH74_11400 [Gemmatimonadetes bacterium]|jgi:predicted enzyme related to lactoylglutathione lyase|nr:hypothetical protein [Gemmatimonadota bacterium]